MGVDPARALGVEEGARALGVRRAGREQLRVVGADPVRLDLEDREVVDAAAVAAARAPEPLGVEDRQPLRCPVDVFMDPIDA